jgi:hypothetical protein
VRRNSDRVHHALYVHQAARVHKARDATGCLGDVQMGRLRCEIPSLRGVLPTPRRRRFPQTTLRGLLRESCTCCHYICRRRIAISDRQDHGSHANSEGVEVHTHKHARTKSTLTVTDPLLLDADLVSAASLMGTGWDDRNSGRQYPYCCSA